MRNFILCLLFVTLVSCVYRKYDNCLLLDSSSQARVHWTMGKSDIHFGIEAKVESFLAFGISKDRHRPLEGELLDGWIGTFHGKECATHGCLYDASFLSDEEKPKIDTNNDLKDIFMFQNNSILVIEFSRSLDTKDSEDQPINPLGQFLFWSTKAKFEEENLVEISMDGSYLFFVEEFIDSCIPFEDEENDIEKRQAFSSGTAPLTGTNVYASANGKVTVKWTIDPTQTTITFTMIGTAGWVGIGFNQVGKMANCDMIVGWVSDTTGMAYLYDVYSSGYSPPPDDTTIGGTKDVTLLFSSQIGGKTTLAFKRLLVTPDTKYDQAITLANANTIYLEWAYSDTDGTPGPPLSYPEHPLTITGGGGSVLINFFTGGITATPFYLLPGQGLLIIVAGILGIFVAFRMIKKLIKFIMRKQAKKRSNYTDHPITWAKEERIKPVSSDDANVITPTPPSPPSPSSSMADSENRETKIIPNSFSSSGSREVSPRPPMYGGGNRSGRVLPTTPPNPYRPRPYEQPAPVQNNTFTGSFYRGSQIVYPKSIQEKTMTRFRKEEERRTQIKIVKDNTDRKVDAEIISEKSIGNPVFNYLDYITSWRFPRTQITIGFLLLVVVYIGINVGCYFFYGDYYYAIGSLTAANGLLVALPANRNGISTWLLGISFDRTIVYHRWLGRWTIFLALLHWITAWIFYSAQNNNNLGVALNQISSTQKDNFGYPAFAALVIMFFTSLDWIRRNQYEIFYYLHYFFIIFYLFGALHSFEMEVYAIIAAVIYVLDRVIRIMYGALPMKTVKLKSKPGDITQIVFPKHVVARMLGVHKVGQYMFVNFPTISPLEWHPFSVSSGPDETTIEIHVKALGDHTRKLTDTIKERESIWVRSDGPYGNLKINFRRFPVFFLAAGGIGVTPIIGILKDIYRYGELDPKAKTRHKSLLEKVYFIWTVQNMEQYLWFAEEVKWFVDASKKGNSLPDLEVHVFVTKGDVDDSNAIIHKGRPDFFGIFGKLGKDHQEKPSIVFTCGPRKLVNMCWDAVSEQQRDGAVIHFHHETFEF